MFAGLPEAKIEELDRYGRELGIAFQIADDLLDLQGEEDATGKSLGTDLEKQKPTLPVIHALGNWGLDWRTGSDERRQRYMRDAGPAFIEELMDELRVRHLGTAPTPHDGPARPGAFERLDAACTTSAEQEQADVVER